MESFRKVRPCVVKEFSSVAMEKISASSINVTLTIRNGLRKELLGNQVSFGEPSEFTKFIFVKLRKFLLFLFYD